MVCYYDSSFILASLLEQNPAQSLAACWDEAEIRLSSTLLRIECLIGIRRAGALQNLPPDSPWVAERIGKLGPFFDETDCKRVDDDIESIVRATSALSDCRALDAIHLATALYFKPFLDTPITMVTMDARMKKLAGRLGFPVLPAYS